MLRHSVILKNSLLVFKIYGIQGTSNTSPCILNKFSLFSFVPKVSFLILDFLKGEKVLENIRGILAQEFSGKKEIIVVDNSCNSRNAQILKKGIETLKNSENFKIGDSLTLKISEKNLGYTKGNNLAKPEISGELVCVVNPDIVWTEKDTLQKLAEHMQKNTEVAICAPRQKNLSTGEREISVRKFPKLWLQIIRRTPLAKITPFQKMVEADEMKNMNAEKTQNVDWIQSSFMMISRNFWEEIGGFDERFFLFMADTEICWQAWKKGKKVQFFAETEVGADGLRCSDGGVQKFLKSWVLRQHLSDAWEYSRLHASDKNPRCFTDLLSS